MNHQNKKMVYFAKFSASGTSLLDLDMESLVKAATPVSPQKAPQQLTEVAPPAVAALTPSPLPSPKASPVKVCSPETAGNSKVLEEEDVKTESDGAKDQGKVEGTSLLDLSAADNNAKVPGTTELFESVVTSMFV